MRPASALAAAAAVRCDSKGCIVGPAGILEEAVVEHTFDLNLFATTLQLSQLQDWRVGLRLLHLVA